MSGTGKDRAMQTETIAMVRQGRGMDFDRYVARVFRSAETAHKYQNGLDHNVTIVRLPGKWTTGQRVGWGIKGEVL